MARLRDIPHVYNTVGGWTFVKRVFNQSFFDDNLLVWAAALAYSWLLALFPFLIFCLSLVPLLPDRFKPSEATILENIEQVLVTGESMSDAASDVAEEVISEEEESNDPDLNEPGDAVPTTMPASDEDIAAAEASGEPEPEPRQPAIISQTITALVTDLINQPPTTFSLIFSVGVALFLASNGVSMTMAGLDECYDVASDKIRPFWQNKPIAMLLTLTLAILILLTVVILPIGGEAIRRTQGWLEEESRDLPVSFGWLASVSWLIRWTLGLLLMLTSVGLLYRFGTSVKTRLHLFSPGTVFTVAMWVLTAFGFQYYITSFGAADSYQKTYGAVAGVAILMFLFYVDALLLLVGAEINAEIDFIRLGIKSGPMPEEREVAPIPPYQLDEEDLELKAELEERRSIDIPPPEEEFGDGAMI